MSKNKPLNFEGATLRHSGGSVRDGLYTRNQWSVTLADGTRIGRCLYHHRGKCFQWERWYPNKDKQYRWDRDGSWRMLQDFDNSAVDEWVKAHAEYIEDSTLRVEDKS